MGKKEIKKRNSFWTFSNLRSRAKPFFLRLHNSSGFTLIELLVVVAIIGIMAVGLMFLIDPLGQIAKANDARRKSDLEQLQRTLEVYYNDNGKYPPHNAVSVAGCSGLYRINPPTGCLEWGSIWSQYNTTLPKDPTSSSRSYVYYSPSTGASAYQSYYLYASLEKSGDPQLCSGLVNGECPSTITNSMLVNSCGPSPGKPCNFGVSSSNVSP